MGGHGWHLHIHALVFSASGLSSGLIEDIERTLRCNVDRDWLSRNIFAARIYQRWSQGLIKAGCRLPGSVAVDVREIADEGAEYVGWYLSKATYDAATRIGLEMGAGGSTKNPRAERNWSPFELLAELAESVDARGFGLRTPRHWAVLPANDGDWAVIDKDTGQVVNITAPGQWKIWHEWEQASRGRRQITWSRRRTAPAAPREVLWNVLLESRGASAVASDEEVATEEVHGEELAVSHRAVWYQVLAWRPSLIVDLLESAEQLEGAALVAWSKSAGIELMGVPPD
ncbi:hypothetical protein [Mycobacteroides abscessus]|uniref:hypothetical protein n=1 Tax=Mycobacteroides abscessus TaxID=36809 RepID=UPI001F207EA3|nr:hypothetical protein [Mycobacteroides abscessus]